MESSTRTGLASRAAACGLCALGLCGAVVQAQTETPYERSLKQQQLYDQQQQNARQQQQLQQQQQDQQWQQSVQQSQAQQRAAAAQGQAVLQTWQKRPQLAPENNPLLGRWDSRGSGGAKPPAGGADIAALANALVGGVTAGLCDSMLGRGLIEFRPAAVVAIGRDGSERVKYHVQYRGGGSRVVVLPQDAASFTHMIIDLDGRDRATVATVGCVLVRAGGPVAATAREAPADRLPTAAQWELLGTSAANGGMDIYIARSMIRRSGTIAQMFDLWDFKTAHVFEGKRFLSARNHYEYDCAGTRRRMLATVGFAEHMGRGAVVGSGDSTLAWEPIPPAGPLRDYWKIACAKA
jgi:hypothetical protein